MALSLMTDKAQSALDAMDGAHIAEIAVEAEERANKVALLRALAATVVSLAADLGGHDSRYRRTSDQIHADNIGEQLIAVMETKVAEMPRAFRQFSSTEDMAKANAVSRAVKGDDK